jgi:hypothetical protein
MIGHRSVVRLALLVSVSFAGALGARAEEPPPTSAVEVRALYDRLEPGMSIGQVAEAAKRPQLLTNQAPITPWLIWSRTVTQEATVVVRAFFQDARLARIEYESFGEEYQRLIKGTELTLGLAEAERRRLSQSRDALAHCSDALNAYHQLRLRAQERLTPAEQQVWGRALELRRAVEGELKGLQ